MPFGAAIAAAGANLFAVLVMCVLSRHDYVNIHTHVRDCVGVGQADVCVFVAEEEPDDVRLA